MILPLARTGVDVELNPNETLPFSESVEPSARTVVRTRSATLRVETTSPVAGSTTLTVPESSAMTP